MYYLGKTRTHIFKIISMGMCFVLIFSSAFPRRALAARSDAGGGELAEVDFGDLAISAGISLGAMAVGTALNAGISSLGTTSLDAAGTAALAAGDFSYVGAYTSPDFFSAIGDSFAKSFNVDNMLSGLSTFGATSQVGRAVSTAGQYYGWDPSTTYLVSNIASAATGGFLNPSVALGTSVSDFSIPTMARGAVVGGLTGLASAGAVVLVDGNRMDDKSLSADERRPGAGAQIAGMFAGVVAGNFSRTLVDPVTYKGIGNQDMGRLAEVTFSKTVDETVKMWPRVAARSLAIVASGAVDRNNKFFTPSTVSSLVEGATLPMFRSIANPDPKTSFSLSNMGFGLVEGFVHGSTSYLISKASKDDPSFGNAASYVSTLVSGAVRGAVQRGMWDSVSGPQEIAQAEKAADLIQDSTTKEERKRELKEYQKTMEGGYPIAILTSTGKANTEFLDRTFAFGLPRGKPENIDSLAMVDYFSRLNTYAAAGQRPDWLVAGLNSSLTSAGSFAASNNVVTTLGAFNTSFTRDVLNIAPFAFQAKPIRGESDIDRIKR